MTTNKKPKIVLICLTIFIVILNGFAAYAQAQAKGIQESSVLLGYVLGGSLIFPLLIVGLFQFIKRFRNPNSRLNIFFWSSLLGFISKLAT